MGNKLRIWLLFGAVFISFTALHVSSKDLDPYAQIGVSRSASPKEIKRAYKNLARHWHPDKNKEEGAQEKFIQIQQAYEILSDEEKRAEYDMYGHVNTDNQPRHQHHQRHDPFSGFHFGGGFDGFQFRFPNKDSAGSDPRRVTLSKFDNGILPESRRKPFLLFVTGDWCFNCVRIEGIWNDAAAELEAIGIGMGTVHGDYSRPLLRKLGVYQWPSIVGVVEGKVVVFDKNQVSAERLKEFVQSLLPSDLIIKVTDANQESFLSGWQVDNRPRSLLFSRRSSPSLLYHVLAFRHRDAHTFGFAQNNGPGTTELVWKFDVPSHEPTILIFKDNTEEYTEKIQSSKIDMSLLEDAIERNRHLFVARLTSQKFFENHCPEASFGVRKLCVVLITRNPSVHKEHLDFFRQVVRTTESFPGDPQFAHVHQETQREWVRFLGQTSKFDMDNSVPVIIIKRLSDTMVAYDWLPQGWHGNEPDDDKQALIYFLQQVLDNKHSLKRKMVLPELKDENAPHWLLAGVYTVLNVLRRYANVLKQILFSAWSESSVAFLVVVAYLLAFFVAFAGLINTGKEAMQGRSTNSDASHGQDGESYASEGRGRSGPGMSNQSMRQMPMHELNEATYEKFLASGRHGHILLLLLTDRSNRDSLCQLFRREAHMHIASHSFLLPAFLMLDTYAKWLPNLFASIDGLPPDIPTNGVGTVLAIRPSKSYFYIFQPCQGGRRTGWRRGGLNADFVGFRDSSDSDSEPEAGGCVLLEGLGMWLDRLLDGGLPRFVVNTWPSLE